MPDPVVNQNIGVVQQGGAAVGVINNPQAPVHVGGQQYYGPVTINQDVTVEALRKAGALSRLTPRLPEEQFRQLLGIVGRVSFQNDETFFRIYRATLPPSAFVLNSTIPSLLLADLCEHEKSTGKQWPPIFEFVERLVLAEGVEAAVVSELQHWVDASAGMVIPPVYAKEIERMRQEVRDEVTNSPGSDALSYLQIYLEPAKHDRTEERKVPRFMVELVLWSPLTKGALVLQSEQSERVRQEAGKGKHLCTLDELPSLLDEAFANNEYVSLIPDMTQLLIEIVAPSDVLLYSFERWKRNNTVNTYGIFLPLVVRLQDRLAIPNAAEQAFANDYWRKKWLAFNRTVCRRGFEELQWRTPDELDVFALQDNADLPCLGLSSPLLPEQREVFDVLRDAGIPIALWLRGDDLGLAQLDDLPQRIQALIKGKPLSNLPKAVQEIRRSKAVRTDEKHLGNALTLLWDDPDRPPLKYEEQGVFV